MLRVIVFAAFLAFAGCGGSNPATVSTPAAPQSIDLQMARDLLTAQTAIEQAKTLVPANPSIRDPLNKIIASYNAAESSYLIFHAAVANGGTADATIVQAQIVQLTANVAALVQLFGKAQ